jgi:hypothetical protein
MTRKTKNSLGGRPFRTPQDVRPANRKCPAANLGGIAEAYKILGFPSANPLYEAISSGLLRLSDGKEKEVRDRRKPGAKKPRYQFHIPIAKSAWQNHLINGEQFDEQNKLRYFAEPGRSL